MKNLSFFLLLFCAHIATAQTQFSVTFPKSKGTSFDGRLMLFLAKDNKSEPKFQVNDESNSQQIFGQNVDGWQADKATLIAPSASGYPVKSLANFPAGEYWVQALLHKYETFKLKTGYTVKLPMDRGEGQNFRTAPGNLYSKPFKIKFDPKSKEVIKIVLDQENPTLPEPKDTKYIKHIKIQSKLLTEFWGRPMYLGAHVLLPHGFDEHPEAKYPICINHGHFPADFDGFKETPPPTDMDTTDYIARFGIYGYKKFVWQEAYNFYKQWTSKDFPRMLIIEIPQGYNVRLGGEQEEQMKSMQFLSVAFLGAILLIFLILVTQFNSMSKPFIIFFTVLFSLIGVLLGFMITGKTMSIIMTGVGIFALAGIVIKNGILLIEFTEELRGRGMPVRQALIEAGAARLTPVLLTASACILGLVPLAIGMNINFVTLFTEFDPQFFIGGFSAVFWGSLAFTIIFGLSFSTLLTLIMVPAMYYIVERLKNRFGMKDSFARLHAEHAVEPVINGVDGTTSTNGNGSKSKKEVTS